MEDRTMKENRKEGKGRKMEGKTDRRKGGRTRREEGNRSVCSPGTRGGPGRIIVASHIHLHTLSISPTSPLYLKIEENRKGTKEEGMQESDGRKTKDDRRRREVKKGRKEG